MKRGTPRHPKIYDLLQALDLPVRSRAVVIGYLELLWHFTAEFAPQGDIGKFSDDRLEGAMDWGGKRGKLIEALTTSKWCDVSSRHRLLVHDWHEHADDSVKKKLVRAGLSFLTVTEKVTGHSPQPSQTSAENGSLPLPKPEPLPEPLPKPPSREPISIATQWKSDEQYTRFAADYLGTGAALIDSDFAEAYTFCWRLLSFEQKLERIAALNKHAEEYHADPRYVPKPLKFLEKEWERPCKPKARDSPDRKLSVTEQARELMRQERERGNDRRPGV